MGLDCVCFSVLERPSGVDAIQGRSQPPSRFSARWMCPENDATADSAGPDSHSVNGWLGYPEAKTGHEGRAQWYVQDAAEGLKYCACVETRRVGNDTYRGHCADLDKGFHDLLKLVRQRCSDGLAKGYDEILQAHVEWWMKFWAQSSVSVPEPAIRKYYVFARVFYGRGVPGAPPMPLQGVWSANNGSLPPWHGDYHSDLNTQMTYMAYQEAGNFEAGGAYLDHLWNLAPTFQSCARLLWH